MVWLKWRERCYPHGSILADDMGLGKTLTILSYLKMCKDEKERRAEEKNEEQEEEDEENEDNYEDDTRKYLKKLKSKAKSSRKRASAERLKTLIILPASLLHQWQGEIQSKFQPDSFKFHVYHDANRKKFAYNLDDNDIVFTTYEIVARELGTIDKDGNLISCVSYFKHKVHFSYLMIVVHSHLRSQGYIKLGPFMSQKLFTVQVQFDII